MDENFFRQEKSVEARKGGENQFGNLIEVWIRREIILTPHRHEVIKHGATRVIFS